MTNVKLINISGSSGVGKTTIATILVLVLSNLNKKVLHLNLYRKYFDEIASGIKTIEYRDITPYWIKRLSNKNYDYIYFRNGYSKDAPMMLVEYKGVTITNQFEITLGEVLYVWNVS